MLNVHLLIKDKIKRVYKQFPIRIGKKKKKVYRKAFENKRLCNLPKKHRTLVVTSGDI